ncbi:MAG: glycerophosphodiester phosphodiesterase [Bacteroidota bacterium]|nr:glycerophosphodiester phosphodiesterase [Bacteroidota bacterium]MDP4234099.1 glycerophosphodiester phosphodiesterase [Bacteroidota bacterium]MDP4243040.1 glycerophosphodiester phosphodiesterase [Bacteroidota bacterium]MDP4287466.1 glycerophosphodiester phosphodiesterase [Bacteroidota bacterium]
MIPLRDYPFAARPMIIAHRGDTSLGARENSIEAVAAALASGADMIELDVQWTADEEFVCWHDESHRALDEPVHRTMFKDTRHAGITSLVEICEAVRDKAYLNIEVKEYSARDPKRFMHRLVELLRELSIHEHVLLSSFRIDYLQEAGWELPTFVIHPDEEMRMLFTLRAFAEPVVLDRPLHSYLPSELMKIARATGYGCQLAELTPDALADIRKCNILLGVYTITTELEFDQAVSRGARALVCEKPHEFVELRNRRFPVLA